MRELFGRVYDFAWPDFRVYNGDDLSRYLRFSLCLFAPLFLYYSAAATYLAMATDTWMALVYAPQLVTLAVVSLFVSFLGTRLGGCILEIAALVIFKLSFWQLLLGGGLLKVCLTALFLLYSTNLARACFALANERYNGHW